MAGYIKGITIEFGADVSQLNGALKKTQGALNKTQSELKQVNRSLKFNPGNTTLLRQKFELLQKSVAETEGKLKQLRAMQSKMNAAGVDKTSAQYRQLEREIIKCENQLDRAQGDLRKFGSVGKQQALAVGNAFKTAGGKIKSAGKTITTSVSIYGMAAIYGGAKLISMSEKQAQAENKLAEIYKSRMGVGKKAVQSTLDLAAAEQKAGVVGDEVQLAAAQQLATYAKMPSTVNTMLPAINDLLVQQKGMNATQEDASALANLFGKAMMGQTGALKRAGISFTAAQEEVLKYGTEEEKAAMIAEVVNQNVGDMNEAFAKTDAGKIQQAKNALGDMGEEIGAILLPAVADMVSWFQAKLMPKLQQFIDYLKQHPQIAKFALAFALITAALGPVLIVIGSLVSAIGGVITIATTLGVSIGAIAGPIGIAIAAIGAAIAIGIALYKNWDDIKKYAKKTWTDIKKNVLKLVTALKANVVKNFNTLKKFILNVWNGIKNAVTTAVNTIKSVVTTVFNGIKTAITTVLNVIKTIISAYVNGWKTIISTVLTAIKTVITTSVNGWKTILSNAWNAIKTTAKTAWNAIKTAITKPITDAKAKLKAIIDGIKKFFPLKISSAWSGIKSLLTKPISTAKDAIHGLISKIKGMFPFKVKSAWSGIKDLLTKPITDAKDKVKAAVDKIKGIFPLNIGKVFSGLKLPHFKITSKGKFPWGIAGKGSLPKWDVSWYRKAMQQPYMFSGPTFFGAGEAGDEMLYGRSALMKDIAQAVGGGGGITVNVYGSDGMSVTELANAVERKLIKTQQRRTQAWA